MLLESCVEMELPSRSNSGPDDEPYPEETEDKEDIIIDNRVYNGYQGSLMEPADISQLPAEGSVNAQNSSSADTHHRCICLLYVVCALILRFANWSVLLSAKFAVFIRTIKKETLVTKSENIVPNLQVRSGVYFCRHCMKPAHVCHSFIPIN